MALPFRHCSTSRLDEIATHGVLCVFDFDGTLAPLAINAQSARVPLGILLRSVELSTYAPLAVVAGRACANGRDCLEFDPDFVIDGGDASGGLARLMVESGAYSLVYVGNDLSDKDLRECDRHRLLSVRIGHVRNSEAEFFLPHRLDVYQLLDELIRRLRQTQARNWIRDRQGGQAAGVVPG